MNTTPTITGGMARTADLRPLLAQRACLAVMYHYVRPCADSGGVVGLSATDFAQQVDRLGALFEPMKWTSLIPGLSENEESTRRGFILTFDDGLAEHADAVASILESRGLRGLFFVSTSPLTDAKPLTPHLVHALLERFTSQELHERIAHWFKDHNRALNPLDASQQMTAEGIYNYESIETGRLKYLLNYVIHPLMRRALLEDLVTNHVGSIQELTARWYMTESQIRELYHRGHTIGGHGHSHEPLGQLSLDEQREDIRLSHAWHGQRWGNEPLPMSFPFGSFTEETVRMCREEGFAAAFTTSEQWIDTSSNPLRLPRVDTIHVESFIEGIKP